MEKGLGKTKGGRPPLRVGGRIFTHCFSSLRWEDETEQIKGRETRGGESRSDREEKLTANKPCQGAREPPPLQKAANRCSSLQPLAAWKLAVSIDFHPRSFLHKLFQKEAYGFYIFKEYFIFWFPYIQNCQIHNVSSAAFSFSPSTHILIRPILCFQLGKPSSIFYLYCMVCYYRFYLTEVADVFSVFWLIILYTFCVLFLRLDFAEVSGTMYLIHVTSF